MDHSHLPPNRKRSEAECKATVMLLNGDKVGAYWYGSKGHVIIHDSAWEEDEEDYGDRSENTRTYVDADTMEPITRKEVFRRINAYDEWMEQELKRRDDERRAYHEGHAVGDVLPRR